MLSKHVTKDISAYCNGELTVEQSKGFAAHIISCARCRAKYEDIKLGVKLAEQLPQLNAPEQMWSEVETLLGRTSPNVDRENNSSWNIRRTRVAIAVVVLLLISFGAFLLIYRPFVPSPQSPSWQVERLNGTPRIESEAINDKGRLAIGQWLETDGNSSAQIAVSSIGQVKIDPNTRVRLLETSPTEHRLELAKGKVSALLWAPPRLFFVDTPSAVAADLGCAYTLEVDDSGGSLLRVTSGWVSLELQDRESMVPAGAACQTKRGIGPGTPYFEDSSPEFREALAKIDFEHNTASVSALLSHSRNRDTLTLWHLLSRVSGQERLHVYEKIAEFVPPPTGVTQDGVLRLDQQMLDLWRDKLEASWNNGNLIPKKVAEAYWQIKNGLDRRTSKLKGN